MKLFLFPGSCALGILILLEELDIPFETGLLDISSGEQFKPPFSQINPKGKVPTLQRDDGSVLTEYPAIALWLAKSHTNANLLSTDFETEIQMIEMMCFITSDVHKAGFTNIIVPHKLTSDTAAQDDIRKAGIANANKGFDLMSEALGDQEFFFGSFSIVDATAFYVCCWAKGFNVELPANLEKFHAGMAARPAVQRALKVWTPKMPST